MLLGFNKGFPRFKGVFKDEKAKPVGLPETRRVELFVKNIVPDAPFKF